MSTISHSQTTAREYMRGLRLPGTYTRQVLSPYFQRKNLREEATRQGYQIILVTMKAFIEQLAPGDSTNIAILVSFTDNSGNVVSEPAINFPYSGIASSADFQADILAAINGYASSHSYTLDGGIYWSFSTIENVNEQIAAAVPSGLASAPLSAVSDAPTDAEENLSALSILTQVISNSNASNVKQNQIAAQLNTVIARLEALGLIES